MAIKFNPGCPCCQIQPCGSCSCTKMASYSKVRITFSLSSMQVVSRTAGLAGKVTDPNFCGQCVGYAYGIGGYNTYSGPIVGSIPGSCDISVGVYYYQHDGLTNTFPGLGSPSLVLNYDLDLITTKDSVNYCNQLSYSLQSSTTTNTVDVACPYIAFDCASTQYGICNIITGAMTTRSIPDGSAPAVQFASCCKNFTVRNIPYTYEFHAQITPCLTNKGTVGFSFYPVGGIGSYVNVDTPPDPSGLVFNPCAREELLQYYEYQNDSLTGNGANPNGNANTVQANVNFVCSGSDWYATFDGTNVDGVRLTGTIIPLP